MLNITTQITAPAVRKYVMQRRCSPRFLESGLPRKTISMNMALNGSVMNRKLASNTTQGEKAMFAEYAVSAFTSLMPINETHNPRLVTSKAPENARSLHDIEFMGTALISKKGRLASRHCSYELIGNFPVFFEIVGVVGCKSLLQTLNRSPVTGRCAAPPDSTLFRFV